MRYFVIGDDGQKYGPADIATLQSWIAEGRLLPTQQLEEEASGIRAAARAVPGLQFPATIQTGSTNPNVPQGSPYGQSGNMQGGYARPGDVRIVGDDGQQDVTLAWVFGVIGLLVCCVCDIPAFIFMNRAMSKGHPGANAVRIFCFVVLGLQVVGALAYIGLVVMAVKSGAGMPNQPMRFRAQ